MTDDSCQSKGDREFFDSDPIITITIKKTQTEDGYFGSATCKNVHIELSKDISGQQELQTLIHELIEVRKMRNPWEFGDLSHEHLNTMADHLGRCLYELGVRIDVGNERSITVQ